MPLRVENEHQRQALAYHDTAEYSWLLTCIPKSVFTLLFCGYQHGLGFSF